MKSDYLKFWRVIHYYIKAKYGLTTNELDMLLFLYTEDYFTTAKFHEFNNILPWNKNRFEKLKREGWIQTFRHRVGKTRAIYEISPKAKRVVSSIYKYLEGTEIPTTLDANPMFHRNVKYTDKVYRNMIIKMNKYTRDKKKGLIME